MAATLRKAGIGIDEEDVDRLFAAGFAPGSDEVATLQYFDEYDDDLGPLFDSEFRAITAHVLPLVGERSTRHVFAVATAESPEDVDMDELHATEVMGSAWLVYPIKEPTEWSDGDESALVDALLELQETDYRREADLGRVGPTGDPYRVR